MKVEDMQSFGPEIKDSHLVQGDPSQKHGFEARWNNAQEEVGSNGSC
jgi:hypothetical protein